MTLVQPIGVPINMISTMPTKPLIQRELGENDAEITIYQEPDGSICLTMSQVDGANKDSTAAKIAKALIDVAIDDINTIQIEPQITSYQSRTIN